MFVRTLSKYLSRVAALAIGLAVTGAMFASTAQAQTQPLTRKSVITFSQPIEIPGVGTQVLPAGTYVLKLLDSTSERHIVQIFSKDEKHIFATILAVPNYRLKSTNHTTITFAERAAGSPPAMRAWFYPGDNWGQEFVYPKVRAQQIAKETNQPVLFVSSDMAENIAAPSVTAMEPPVIALKAAPIQAFKPSGEETAMSDYVDAPPTQMAASAPAPAAKAKKLPKTGDNLPLVGMLVMLSIGAAFTLRRLCSH
jgi:hypothetical protein